MSPVELLIWRLGMLHGPATWRKKSAEEIAADIEAARLLADSRREMQRQHETVEIVDQNGQRLVVSRRDAAALQAEIKKTKRAEVAELLRQLDEDADAV